MAISKKRIAVFSGATSTVLNTPPLVTSNKARELYGLPVLTDIDGTRARFDVLRPQRLAAPVTAYIEQFSAHPLEVDASELYAPPDGYIDGSGEFSTVRQTPSDTPVYRVTINPDDGLLPLPYMARQASGDAWDGDRAHDGSGPEYTRQPFYPDSTRLFEEIDRLSVGANGQGNLLSSKASYDHFRVVPSGGYTKGLASTERTDVGVGDIPAEVHGRDFFPYRPHDLRREPSLGQLARVTNQVQEAMQTGDYAGAIWLEGSPFLEETLYWLNLLIDCSVPIVGVAAHRPHGAASNDGDQNVVDAVDYICSGLWADEEGADRIGAVAIQDERIMTSREVQKSDARPGGHIVTGGHGGIVGSMGQPGPAVMTFLPLRRHTASSQVNVSSLPREVTDPGVGQPGAPQSRVQVVDDAGRLAAESIPHVSIFKHVRYAPRDSAETTGNDYPDIEASIHDNVQHGGLAGFVLEGAAPYGRATQAAEDALRRATLRGMPVVAVGRGNAEGFVPPGRLELAIAGNNLTATKARLLLMACLLRFGALPVPSDPDNATREEILAIKEKIEDYQAVFDSH